MARPARGLRIGTVAWVLFLGIVVGGALGALAMRLVTAPGPPEFDVRDTIVEFGMIAGAVSGLLVSLVGLLVALVGARRRARAGKDGDEPRGP